MTQDNLIYFIKGYLRSNTNGLTKDQVKELVEEIDKTVVVKPPLVNYRDTTKREFS